MKKDNLKKHDTKAETIKNELCKIRRTETECNKQRQQQKDTKLLEQRKQHNSHIQKS